MALYLYNARDIAAYFKWAGVPAHLEKDYLQFLFEKSDGLLARPLSANYGIFEQEVFREMYYLWSVGFENEYSDVELIAPDGAIAIFCNQKFIALESYMKLIALHLMLSGNLPYVRINFVGLPLLLGISGDYVAFEENLTLAFSALRLQATDIFGKEFDLNKGIPNELLCISLQKDLKDRIFGEDGTGRRARPDSEARMRALVEKSLKDKEIRDKDTLSGTGRKPIKVDPVQSKSIIKQTGSDHPNRPTNK
ncbi:MAG: hypothetical protein JW817_05410 [Clostridiales bacterium]|nr:hypothetical protein [Clostridiales bacterium]